MSVKKRIRDLFTSAFRRRMVSPVRKRRPDVGGRIEELEDRVVPAHVFSRLIGGTSFDPAYSVALDGSGNSYAAGVFSGTVNFGGTSLTSAGSTDAYLAKYSSAGSLVWVQQFGGTSDDYGQGVATDASGNVYVTGYSRSTSINFGGGPLGNSGSGDVYVAKFTPTGGHIYSRTFGGTGDDLGWSVTADSAGNTYLAGFFASSSINFGGGALANAQPGSNDVFLTKLDGAGNHVYSKVFGGSASDQALEVAVSSTGIAHITGSFVSTSINFGGGPLANAGSSDIFVAKFDSAGTHIYSKRFGTSSNDVGRGIALDGAVNAYLTGDFFGSGLNFGGASLSSTGAGDIFVAGFDVLGNHILSRPFGGAGTDTSEAVAVDGAGNIYLTGMTNTPTINFGGGALSNAGSTDVFALKLSAAAVHVSSRLFGGTAADHGYEVAADSAGNVSLVGRVDSASIEFGGATLSNAGSTDGYLARFNNTGFGSLTATLSSGSLTITDLDGTRNNNLTVSVSGTNLVISDANEAFGSAPGVSSLSNGNKTLAIALAFITGSLTFNTGGGSDTLTIDLNGGDAIPTGGISFAGGESASDNDRLVITRTATVSTIGVAHTGSEAGNVDLSGLGVVTFSQIEPLFVDVPSADLTITLPAGPNTSTTLGDDGVAPFDGTNDAGKSAIYDSTSPYSFEYTEFTNPTNSLTINRGSASDNLNVLNLVASGLNSSITVGSAGSPFNAVTFSGAVSLAANQNLTVNAASTINIPNAASDLATSGTGTISLTTARNIAIGSGASVTTVNGGLTLSANQQGSPTAGNFAGIDVNAGLVQVNGTGSLSVSGKGGTDSGGAQFGIYVRGGGDVIGGTSANTTVTGAGGINAGSNNNGVRITGAGTTITSAGGNVSITGTDLNGADSSSGIQVISASSIAAGGSGSVTVQGTSQGVYGLVIGDSTISSAGGNISLTGTITGAGANGTGLALLFGQVTAGGSGTVTATGTGGTVGGQTYGVWLYDATSRITSAGGAISVTGTGSAISAAIQLDATGAPIASGGTGNITLTADSFEIADPINTTIRAGSSGGGTVTILPRTASTLINVGGSDVLTGSPLTLGLTDAELDSFVASTVEIGNTSSSAITVTAPITHSNNLLVTTGAGITLNQPITMAANKNLTANAAGTISLPAITSDVSTSGSGTISFTTARNISLASGSSVSTVNGNLSLSANQQTTATTGNFVGIDVNAGLIQATGSGTVTVQGDGGNDSAGSQIGVRIFGGGDIIGGTSNLLTVQGTGGASTGTSNWGVNVLGVGSTISSSGGNVSVSGTGGGSGVSPFNLGVILSSSGQIKAGGGGTVTVTGQGGNSAGTGGNNHGVYVNTSSAITSSGGSVSVGGTGGGAGSSTNNLGVRVDTASQITAVGTGTVTVVGQGGNLTGTAGSDNIGVHVVDANSMITSSGGAVSVTGTGGGAGSSTANIGVRVESGGRLTAAGSGSVTVVGQGGNLAGTGAGNHGVLALGTSSTITSGGGNVSVTGTEGGNTSIAIGVTNSGAITTTINGGTVTLVGNSMNFDPTSTVSAQITSNVTLLQRTANVAIDLGAATDSNGGPIRLTDAELDRITAGTINIGDVNSGAITVSADMSRPTSTIVNLTSGSAINFSSGSLNTGGGNITISPGTSASFANDGNDVAAGTLAFASDSNLSINIDGPIVDTEYQQLAVAGTVNLSGVDLVLNGSYVPAGHETFTIVTATSRTGFFKGLPHGTLIDFNGKTLSLNYTPTGVFLFANEAPVATDSSDITNEDVALPIDLRLLLTDPETASASLTYTITTDPVNGTLIATGTPGLYTYTPALNFNGTDDFEFRATDGFLDSNLATFGITINPVNDAPSFVKGVDESVLEDAGTQIVNNWATSLSAGPADESGQNLTFLVSTDNDPLFSLLPFIDSLGNLTYTPADDANGSATVTVELQDNGGGANTSASQTFTIDVAPVNDAPDAQPDNVSVKVGKTVTIAVLANDSDVELGTLQLVSVTTPAYGTVRIVGNTLVYTPKIIKGAVDTFNYSVSDGQGGTSVGTVSVTILDVTPPKVQAVRLYYGSNSFIDASAISRSIVGWDRLYKVAVVLSEEVIANPNALTFTRHGIAVPTTFGWDLATRTATWTPIDPIVDGRTTIRLSASGVGDTSGNLLTKDWVRAFGLLAGDFDGNGIVNKADLKAIKKRFTKPKVALARLADVDGNGIVNQADLDRATSNLGRRLK